MNGGSAVAQAESASERHQRLVDELEEAVKEAQLAEHANWNFPGPGNEALLEIAKKGGMLVSENREATRALAADLLGELSRSRLTGAALQELAQSRWGVSEETRMAAKTAASRIAQRIAAPHGGAP